jgi:hypothetical protein
MRWFIVDLRAEKLQGFPNPSIPNTRTDPNALGVDEDLSQDIVDFAPALITEAHVEFCVGVAK